MKLSSTIASAVVAIISPAVVTITLAGQPDVVKRFRVSVDIVVDGHRGKASAVWELHMAATPTTSGPRMRFKSRVLGEAIPIQLDDGREIIVMRRSTYSTPSVGFGGFIVSCALMTADDDVDRGAEQASIVAAYEGGCVVPSQYRPMVVLANGIETADDLVRLSYDQATPGHIDSLTISVETTSDPVTRGLVNYYPWIEQLPSAEALYSGPGVVEMSHYYFEDFVLQENWK